MLCPSTADHLVGLVGRLQTCAGFCHSTYIVFQVVIPVTEKVVLQGLACQAPGVIGTLLGPVGQVSAFCDCVRYEV